MLNLKKDNTFELRSDLIQKITYRPFDSKYVYFDTKLLERARGKVMNNFLQNNL